MPQYGDVEAAQAIVSVLPDSRWVGAGLAQAYLWAIGGDRAIEDIARHLYKALRENVPFPIANADAFEVVRVTDLVKKQNSQFNWLQ